MKKILLLLLIVMQSLFALVSIVPVEIGSKDGLYGEISASLETKRGNTEKDNYKSAIRATYDSNTTYVTWAELSGEYGEASGIENTNKIYFHLRHIHAITQEDLRYELFYQGQEDKFKLIKYRRLAGTGLRLKLFEIFENGHGYLGLGGFYENVKYTTDTDPQEENIRINTYFAYTIKLGDDSDLSYSLFYQPKYDALHDYATSHKLNTKLHIYKALYLSFTLSWDIDSQPAIEVKDSDFYQETSFVMKF